MKQRVWLEQKIQKHIPTVSQGGAMMWHFFLSLRFTAIHSGILVFCGGLRGPNAPFTRQDLKSRREEHVKCKDYWIK